MRTHTGSHAAASVVEQAVTALRILAIDQIEKARSGHPGLPMGAATAAYVLWARVRRHYPAQPQWWNRDRFVLSAGHGSALLYSLLHLFGYPLSLADLEAFRQSGSCTPGHPEYGVTPGVDATTGPLGQGVANGVGMAIAEAHLAAIYNRPGLPVVDHFTYVLCSDGDLMEGVAAEAASLAGHLGLGKLIVLYDANNITLDGPLTASSSENTAERFAAYGWQILDVGDGNDREDLATALAQAKEDTTHPTLLTIQTVIGYGSPNRAGSAEAHGKPLGERETALVRQAYRWPHTEPFYVPPSVRQHFAELQQELQQTYLRWESLWKAYQERLPNEAAALVDAMKGQFPQQEIRTWPTFAQPIATRAASAKVLQVLAPQAPWLVGGSADLASSNLSWLPRLPAFTRTQRQGRNLAFGVREHAMGAITNGLLLHGGVKAFAATFLVFSDYLRPAIRLAALSQLPAIYLLTHDSLAVGEDGPTHQPVEQLASLRAIPNLTVFRPADAYETVAAWQYALTMAKEPVALLLSRQTLPLLPGTADRLSEIQRGAYLLSPAPTTNPDGILLATGSEVSLALAGQAALQKQGIAVQVVSFPSWERFAAQSAAYRAAILPAHLSRRLAIEAASPFGWERWVGPQGQVIGVETFGASAPGETLLRERGFTVEAIVAKWQQAYGTQRR